MVRLVRYHVYHVYIVGFVVYAEAEEPRSIRGPSFNLQGVGGGWSIFEMNNFERALREINNLLQ